MISAADIKDQELPKTSIKPVYWNGTHPSVFEFRVEKERDHASMPQELLFELNGARVAPHIATFGGTSDGTIGGPTLILKRASASRSSGEWNADDFDVLADVVVVGHHAGSRGAGGDAMPVDLGLRPARGSLADTWIRGHARSCHGNLRQELAARVERG
jgi:hypothetical protein